MAFVLFLLFLDEGDWDDEFCNGGLAEGYWVEFLGDVGVGEAVGEAVDFLGWDLGEVDRGYEGVVDLVPEVEVLYVVFEDFVYGVFADHVDDALLQAHCRAPDLFVSGVAENGLASDLDGPLVAEIELHFSRVDHKQREGLIVFRKDALVSLELYLGGFLGQVGFVAVG